MGSRSYGDCLAHHHRALQPVRGDYPDANLLALAELAAVQIQRGALQPDGDRLPGLAVVGAHLNRICLPAFNGVLFIRDDGDFPSGTLDHAKCTHARQRPADAVRVDRLTVEHQFDGPGGRVDTKHRVHDPHRVLAGPQFRVQPDANWCFPQDLIADAFDAQYRRSETLAIRGDGTFERVDVKDSPGPLRQIDRRHDADDNLPGRGWRWLCSLPWLRFSRCSLVGEALVRTASRPKPAGARPAACSQAVFVCEPPPDAEVGVCAEPLEVAISHDVVPLGTTQRRHRQPVHWIANIETGEAGIRVGELS